jgi:hypothetical protein
MIKFREFQADAIRVGDMVLIDAIRAINGAPITAPSIEAVVGIERVGDDVTIICQRAQFTTSRNNGVFVI